MVELLKLRGVFSQVGASPPAMAADSHGQVVGVQYSLKVGAEGSWKSSQKSKSLINGPCLDLFFKSRRSRGKLTKQSGELLQFTQQPPQMRSWLSGKRIYQWCQFIRKSPQLGAIIIFMTTCTNSFLKKGGPMFHPTFFVPFSANFFFCCSKFCQAPQLSSQTSKSHGEAPSKGLAHIMRKKIKGRRDERDMSAGSKIYNYLVWFHN